MALDKTISTARLSDEFVFRGAQPPKPGTSVEAEAHGKPEDPSMRVRGELPPPIIKIDDAIKDKLMTWLDQWFTDLDSSQQDLQRDWARYEKAYRARTPGALEFEPFAGASREVVPVVAMAVDPVHARLDTGIFKQDPVFSWKGLTEQLLPLMPSMEKFFDFYQKHHLRLRKVASPRMLECTKLGTMALKVVYDRDEYPVLRYTADYKAIEKVRETRFAGPKVYGVSIGDLWFPPNYEDPQDCPIIFERQRTTWEHLKVLEADGKMQNVDSIRSQETVGERTDLELAQEQASKHALRTTFANEIIVYEIWFDYDLDGDGIPERLVATYHKDSRTFLMLRLNWYFHQRKPYVIIPFTITSNTMHGLGIGEMALPFQEMITQWQRMASDNAYIANIRMFIAKKNSGIEEVPRLYAGRTFFVDDPTKDFIPFAAGDTYPSTLAERQNLFGMVEKRTGISDYLSGRESPIIGTRATATSTLALIQEGTKRVEEVLENFRNGFSEVAVYCVSIWIQYGTNGLEDLIFGADKISSDVKQFFKLVNQQNVNGSFAVELTATDATQNRQAQQQMQLALINVMMGYLEKLLQAGQGALEAMKAGVPEYAAMVGDVMDAARAMFNDLLNKYDLRDAETYLPDLKRYLNNGGQGGQTPPGQGVGGAPEGSTGGAPGTPRLPIPSGPARIPSPASPGVAGSGAAARASAQVAGAG